MGIVQEGLFVQAHLTREHLQIFGRVSSVDEVGLLEGSRKTLVELHVRDIGDDAKL